MELPASSLSYKDTYKLMTGTIVPRPIAWITTISPTGTVNAAPFSAFTLLSQDPPLVLFQSSERERRKDTARNVLASREFVINIPNMSLLDQMHLSSTNLPPEQSEVEMFGIEVTPSVSVAPPRIAAAPVCFECVLHSHFMVGNEPHAVFIGEIKHFYVKDELYENGRIDQQKLQAVCRIGGPWYAVMGELIHKASPPVGLAD